MPIQKRGEATPSGWFAPRPRSECRLPIVEAAMKRAVVLLSGGLDSATTLAICNREGFEPYALSFNYGQRHNIEVLAAKRVAASLGAREHRIAEIDLRVFGGSALTDEIAVPKNRDEKNTNDIPITYVPARNTIFLSYALAWCEVLGAADIFIGVNAIDYSGYRLPAGIHRSV